MALAGSIAFVKIISTTLPTEDVGQLMLSTLVSAVAVGIIVGPTSQSLIRLASGAQIHDPRYGVAIFLCLASTIGAALTAGAVFGFLHTLLPAGTMPSRSVNLVIALFVADGLRMIGVNVLYATGKVWLQFSVYVLDATARIASIVIALNMGWTSAFGALMTMVILGSFVSMYSLFFALAPLLRGAAGPHFAARNELAKQLAYIAPLFPAAGATWLMLSLDRFFLAKYSNLSEVAIYGAAVAVAARPISVMSLAWLQAIRPIYYEKSDHLGPKAGDSWIRAALIAQFVVSIFAVIALTVFSDELLALLLSREYIVAAPLVPYVGLAYAALAFGQLAEIQLLSVSKTRSMLAANVIGLTTCTFVCFWLVQQSASRGVAVGLLAGCTAYTLTIIFAINETRRPRDR